jgi:assimilatory nitrate reductase electron transfer subunit
VYNRVLIAEHAVGRATRARLDLPGAADAVEAGASVRLGEAAIAIDRHGRVVRTSGGDRIPYDHLVLATGARANIPTLYGMEKARRHRLARARHPERLDRGEHPLPRGVTTLRDLADADEALTGDPFAPDATVCSCNGVTVERITDAVDDGAVNVADVSATTKAGTGCGGCRGRIAELIARTGGLRPHTIPPSSAEALSVPSGR